MRTEAASRAVAHPYWSAIRGVRTGESAPPRLLAMLSRPESEPEYVRERSFGSAQHVTAMNVLQPPATDRTAIAMYGSAILPPTTSSMHAVSEAERTGMRLPHVCPN